MNIREVRRHGDGWGVFDPNASRASAVEGTQAAAQQRARVILANQGGGEMRTRGENGQIRSQDTIKPGNDPRRSMG